MAIQTIEVYQLLRKEVEKLKKEIKAVESGIITEVGDGVAKVTGLPFAKIGDVVEFQNGMRGYVLTLEEYSIGCLILGSDEGIFQGDSVKNTHEILSVPVGEALLGRVLDGFGRPIDGQGSMIPAGYRPIEIGSPGITHREPVKTSLQTGIQAIDALVPIGRGQRQLIIGDRQTGKTSIALDTIINQKDTGVLCVYVAIGQKMSTVSRLVKTLKEHDALKHTIVVAASASDAASLQYIAPFVGCTMAEYFRDRGQDALCVYDDLTKHAVAYRQFSLLLRRPPGREAYPSDIFYLHARLLERAAKLHRERGGGSLTALPIIETQAGDASAYIPTNVISITDGQIVLESSLFNSGVRPAINVGLSVSRVGGSAQSPAMKKLAGPLRINLAQYRELATFSQFSRNIDQVTQSQLERGSRYVELMKQPERTPFPLLIQILAIYAATEGYLDVIEPEEIGKFRTFMISYFNSKCADIKETFAKSPVLTPELTERFDAFLNDFINNVYLPQFHPKKIVKKQTETIRL